MYEELIAALNAADKRPCSDLECPGSGECPTVGCLFREAADAIKELSKLNAEITKRELKLRMAKPRWIPVTERLPEYAGVYLCRIKSFSHEFSYTDTMKCVDGFFYDQGVVTDRVTHWMPLPTPPKEATE